MRGIHWTQRAHPESARLQGLPDLGKLVLHDVTETKDPMLVQAPAAMSSNPLDPRLDIFVSLL
jgi:hypothetical protein